MLRAGLITYRPPKVKVPRLGAPSRSRCGGPAITRFRRRVGRVVPAARLAI